MLKLLGLIMYLFLGMFFMMIGGINCIFGIFGDFLVVGFLLFGDEGIVVVLVGEC